VLLFSLLENVCAAFYPLALGYLIDDYASLDGAKLWLLGGFFFASCGLLLSLDYCNKRLMVRLSYETKRELRKKLFAVLLKESPSVYREHSDEYYSSLLTSDVDALYDKYYGNIIWFLIRVVDFLVFFGLLFFVNWIMALIIFVATIASLFLPKLVGRKLEANEKKVSEGNASYLSDLTELLKGREFVNERTLARFEDIHEKSSVIKEKNRYNASRYQSLVDILQGVSLYLVQAVAFGTGLALLHFNLLSLGGLTISLLLTDLLVYPTNDAFGILLLLKGGKAYEKKISDCLRVPSAGAPYSQAKIETLQVESLGAKSGNFVLSEVSFSLSRGEKMAIVGKNGAGKSTLLKTLLGIEKASSGTLLVNGKEASSPELASESAYISQDIFLFDATVEENITLFGSYPSAAVSSSLSKIKLGKNLNYEVGRNGSCLSGGEKAKIAILRALCRGQSLLIFDEAFAAIDEKSASEILSYLKDQEIMMISVTHDLSPENLAFFDKVLVLKNGKEFSLLSNSSPIDVSQLL
jgi:ABC-type multidrug transport system fused ATPase/permease subunit